MMKKIPSILIIFIGLGFVGCGKSQVATQELDSGKWFNGFRCCDISADSWKVTRCLALQSQDCYKGMSGTPTDNGCSISTNKCSDVRNQT